MAVTRRLREEAAPALLAALVVGAAILVVGTILGVWSSAPALTPGTQVTVASVSIDPQAVRFGDPVEAQVVLIAAGAAARPGALRLEADFAPYGLAGSRTLTRKELDGTTARITFRYRLSCLQSNCIPAENLSVRFPDARVVTSQGAELARVTWPSLTVGSRVAGTPLDPADPAWRDGGRLLAAPDYRLAPGLAFWLLVGGGAALLAAALALAARLLAPGAVSGLVRRRELAPLAEAIVVTRRAAHEGTPAAQRRALERLAAELRRARHDELAASAARLAWAETEPASTEMLELAAEAERP